MHAGGLEHEPVAAAVVAGVAVVAAPVDEPADGPLALPLLHEVAEFPLHL